MSHPPTQHPSALPDLLNDVLGCTICAPYLPFGPRPVLQVDERARMLVASQAPGRKVHESGVPFDDASGERLRAWMGIDPATFYDPTSVAIVPMAFCYPGRGRSGDLPPRPECARKWRDALLSRLTGVRLTLAVGGHALDYHVPGSGSVTDAVRSWRSGWPRLLPLPHPSPRNRGWLRRHPWFENEVVPALQRRVAEVLEISA